jgi:hypothetical protein
MSTTITRSSIEELRERIRRLEDAADRRRLVLPFGLKAIGDGEDATTGSHRWFLHGIFG